MIRKWDTKDTAPLLALWLDSTIHAHPFISESYWRDSVAVVRDVYLPAASTWVWEQDGELKGFVSVLDSRFVGALFVGVGAGLSVRAGGAPGGDDALAMALHKVLHQPIERIYLGSDLVVLALSASYLPLERLACSLLTVLLSGQIIGLIQRIPSPSARKAAALESTDK